MSGAAGSDAGVPAGALGAGLSGFAEAAGVVLATPSECREVMLGALGRCWEELRWVGRHLQPYADDPAEVFDRFETARASLERLLWAAGAAGPARAGGMPTAAQAPAPAEVEVEAEAGTRTADRAVEAAAGLVEAGVGGVRTGAGAGMAVPASGDLSPAAPPGTRPLPGDDGTEAAAAAAADEDEEERGAGEAPPAPAGAGPAKPATGGKTPGPDPAGAGGGVAPARAEPPADPLAGIADALGALEAKLLAEQIGLLPRTPPSAAIRPPATTADRIAGTWQRIHMALLRLPAHLRDEWRAQARETAAAAGLAVTAEDCRDPDVIVPGLPQGLCSAERIPLVVAAPGAAAAGVREEIHHELGTSPGTLLDLPPSDPRPIWAVRAEQALRLVDLDPELHVAVFVEDQPSSLSSQEARLRYRLHLYRLLATAGSSQADGWPADSRLGAAHELDMVLGGLVHKRPAALDSWWWQWRAGVSEILAPLAERARYELVPKAFSKWTRLDVDAYTVKNSVSGQSAEPLVQWVLWTPLKPAGGASRANERKGRIVMRPQPQYGRQASP
ncbi:hypothetical protein [Streptomyces sp. A0592]|uniref:hypothetical protein n=1 Tax=Streptomyces sp. A0592 TaxID=2563099 RepID=UPI00109EB784|nr:hypothetical protein [Streptomyces sp. A0592]THA74357.1 hypothetical protein E6U81_38050 [Streptomyces sp. A0592]